MVFWGAPLESRGWGIWDVPEGGIAVLVRDGHTAEAAKLPKKRPSDPLGWNLWLSATFLHVRVAVRTGSTVLHLLCVYGVPGDPELNAKLWDSVLWGNLCTACALRATFGLCSPRRAPKQTPWKRPYN